jgi:hypothetical protein
MSTPGGDTLLKLFDQLASEAKTALVQADEMARIHRLQGRVQAFEELLRAVDDAKAIEAKR